MATKKKENVVQEEKNFAPDMDINSLLAQIKDIPEADKTQTEAEVWVPGLPDGKGGLGCWAKVKKASVEDELKIIAKCTNVSANVEASYDVPDFNTVEAKQHYFRCAWQLVLQVTSPKIPNLQTAMTLMGRPDSMDIVDPLIITINKLQLSKPPKDNVKNFLTDYALFPEVLEHLKIAYKNDKLVEFLSGDDDTVRVVKDMFRTIRAVQEIVDEEDAIRYGKATAREVIKEYGRAITPPEDREDEDGETEED